MRMIISPESLFLFCALRSHKPTVSGKEEKVLIYIKKNLETWVFWRCADRAGFAAILWLCRPDRRDPGQTG
jgi:hypothetical protein